MPGPALAAALRATTPEVLRTANAYDALVIGAGAAGGLAALLLAEAGVRVLVLEAGRARALVRAHVLSRPFWSPSLWRFCGGGSRSSLAVRYGSSIPRHSSMTSITHTSRRPTVPSSGCALGSWGDAWWSLGMASNTIAWARTILLAPMDRVRLGRYGQPSWTHGMRS